VRRAVDDKALGAVEKETGPAAVRRVPPGLLGALPVHALSARCIVVVVREVGPHQVVGLELSVSREEVWESAMMPQIWLHPLRSPRTRPSRKPAPDPPLLYLLNAVAIGLLEHISGALRITESAIALSVS